MKKIAFLLALLVTSSASAQSLLTQGIDAAGVSRKTYLQDQTNRAFVPTGTLDTSGHVWWPYLGSTPVTGLTGTGGTVVMSVSPTLVTPNLGTPTTVNLANATGLPWSTGIIGKPTTIAGYGITDGITASVAASTYAPLTGSGASGTWGISITGSAPWANITSKPTTLSGYGITDGITAATAASTYAPKASPSFTGGMASTVSDGSNAGIFSGATNLLRVVPTSTELRLGSLNSAQTAYAPFMLDGSSLLLNTITGGSIGIGTTSPSYTATAVGSTSTATTDNAVIEVRNSSVKSTDIWGGQVPGTWHNNDGIRSTMLVSSGTTTTNTSALAFYVRDQLVSGGLGQNAVGLYGLGTCEVDGCSIWSLNPSLSDSAGTSPVSQGARTLVGAEFDISVRGNNTTVQGIALMGSSVQNPLGADGFTCGNLGTLGTTRWTHCLVVNDRTANIGAYFGVQFWASSSANAAAVPLDFGWLDASSGAHTQRLQVVASGFNFNRAPGDSANGIALSAVSSGTPIVQPTSNYGATNVDLKLAALGSGTVHIAPTGQSDGDFRVSGALYIASYAPSTSSSSCSTGFVTFDGSYIYVCYASNTWKRAAISSF